jgi:hypothetical protein
MNEIKFKKFIELANGKRYCILNQKKIGNYHFASAFTVPKEVEEIKNAEFKILQSIIRSNGNIGTREYPKTENDYYKIMSILIDLK